MGVLLPNPDWTDRVVIERVLDGRDPGRPLTPAERRHAAAALAARVGTQAAATRLGVSFTVFKQILQEARSE